MHRGNTGSSIAHQILVQLGLDDQSLRKRLGRDRMLIVAAVAVVVFAAATMLYTGRGDTLLKIATAVSGALVLVLGYLQWRALRHEVSYDKYYDRLAGVNEKFSAYRLDALVRDAKERGSHLNTMFVFGELDILEYILGKRQLGYVHENLAERAIRHFHSRCHNREFCRDVLHQVGPEQGEQPAKGYEPLTREAAQLIVASWRHDLTGPGETAGEQKDAGQVTG
jgi:hypothetical protein